MEENTEIDSRGAGESRRSSWPANTDPDERAAARRPWGACDAAPMPSSNQATARPVIGYASCALPGAAAALELKEQAEVITRECKRRGLELLEVVGEGSAATGKRLSRPGLAYTLDRLNSGEASGMVVVELSRITQSVGELGRVIEWLLRLNVRLIASVDALDTDTEGGRLAADLLIAVSGWERTRISERTRHGLQAARMNGRSTGRAAVADDPDLSQRIAQMRAQGMTLQAIADRLNEEGVPTVRGGAKWRHSSVQAAAGYRRGQRLARDAIMSQPVPAGEQIVG
jgi:DNA invertase Pin-like site-specific DNA recombinase